jgi:hypothetical protein
VTDKIFTITDLYALLTPLSGARRRPIAYTLDSRGTIDNTLVLGWKEALRLPVTEFA